MNTYSRHLFIWFFISILLSPILAVAGSVNIGTEIVISRSENKLFVMKNGITLKQYYVAFGMGGMKGKRLEGDRKTPLGDYQVITARDSSRFHRFILLNYPAMEDAERALGTHLITQNEYQRIVNAHRVRRLPPQDTALGGAIGIHGIGDETSKKVEIHNNIDWTKGCIAMRNHEIEELSRYVDVGTYISIID